MAAMLSATALVAHGQTRTESVRADVAITATAVHSDGTSSLGTQGTDLVTAASAGVTVHRSAGLTQIDGGMQLTAVKDARHQFSDRVVPTGNMALRTESKSNGLALDVVGSAQQIRAAQVNQVVAPIQAAGAYNSAQLRVSPSWQRDLTSDLTARVRLSRALVQNWTDGDASTTAPPQDSRNRDDSFALTRRATPLGYGLEWSDRGTDTRDAAAPSYSERTARGVLSHAWSPQLLLGLVAGTTTTRTGQTQRSDALYGARLNWQLTRLNQLSAEVERRFWGQAHRLNLTHNTERLTLGINLARESTTLALYQVDTATLAAASASASGGTSTTTVTTPALSPTVSNGVILREAIGGTSSFALTRRDTVSATAGFVRTSPLDMGPFSALTARARQHYLSIGLEHRLTRTSTLSGNLRWDRTLNLAAGDGANTRATDFAWKTGLNWALNPNTSATMGVQREIKHRTSLPDTSDTQMYLGLNHRL
jgi:uncharacterized protein (PEP-CTERM system associated)